MKKKAALSISVAIMIVAMLQMFWYMENIYPETGTVTEICYETDEVFVETANGNEFSFYGIEDWEVGDIASMIMHSKETEYVKDDEIIDAQYSGVFN